MLAVPDSFYGSEFFYKLREIESNLSFLGSDALNFFLILKTEVSAVRNKRKTFFVCILKATEEKSRIWIRTPVIRIPGSLSKRHLSETLVGALLS